MRSRTSLGGRWVAAVACALGLLGCAPETATRSEADAFILISLSGLRADALGVRGRRPSVTPFLDALADRALFYERAYTTSADTLAAHVSLLSGLYPAEHGVTAPSATLSADAPVLAELLSDFGFRTAGYTSGGYLSSDFGFDRGFDEFGVSRSEARSAFERASEFLQRVRNERFFVFVHSDAIEEALMARFDLRSLAAGSEPLTAEFLRSFEAAYLEAVAGLDRDLEAFFEDLAALGIEDRAIIAVTADHGFEWGEHGRVGHSQVYPETVAVPLLLVGPGLEPKRLGALAQIVDLVPSILSLAQLPAPSLSGVVLPGLPGQPAGRASRHWAVAQIAGRLEQAMLLLDRAGGSRQFVGSHLRGEHDGTWVTREVAFDARSDGLDFSIVSYGAPRTVRLLDGGALEAQFEVGLEWSEMSLPLRADPRRKRLTLRSEDCASPSEVDGGPDRRCLSFKVRGLKLSRSELFDLAADPRALVDISREDPGAAERLRREFDRAVWHRAPAPGVTVPRAATLAEIARRGEYPEPPHS